MSRACLSLEYAHLRRHKLLFAAALFWRSVWELVPMQVPVLAGVIIDGLSGNGLVLYGWSRPGTPATEVLRVAALGLVGIAAVYGISAYAYTVTGARLDKRFVAGLRKAVLEKLMLLSVDHHRRYGAGELLDRTLRDTDRLRGFTERVFTRSVTNALRAGYPAAMLFVISPVLALIALSVMLPQFLTTWWLQRRLHRVIQDGLVSHAGLTTAVKENLDGVETVQGLDAGSAAVARLHRHADRVEADELAANRLTALIRAVVWLMTGLGLALVWWQGGLRVLEGAMTLGTLVAFTGFVDFTYRPVRHFTNIVKTYRSGSASLERVAQLLATETSVREAPDARPLRVTGGVVTFRDVWFAYAGREVLLGVGVEVGPGGLTAVVGRSGSGKTSLLRLMARLYDPDRGEVLIDGQPLTQVTLASLRARVAVVPQHPMLFTGTVLENVRLARPEATPDEVRAACEAAEAAEFIDRLDHGYDTLLGPGGAGLSGGQVQRIAIARALLNRPAILLLDEPTAALDGRLEAAMVLNLQRLKRDMTVVVVAHRPETVRHADRVVVVDDGEVIAHGPHQALLDECDLYRELFGGGGPAGARSRQHARP